MIIDGIPCLDLRLLPIIVQVGWWEWALNMPSIPDWSAKIEYNYLDFGTQTETFMFNTSPCCLPVHSDDEQKVLSLKPV